MPLPAHHEDYAAAAACAMACRGFVPDDEDEWAADVPRSCFNCRLRRWTATGITCMKDSV